MGNYTGYYSKPNVTIRQNLADESESMLNDLINILMTGAYACESMAYYFDRVDIGLFGMADFCRFGASIVYAKAKECMDYLVMRGGRVSFSRIAKPETLIWGSPLSALETVLGKIKDLYDFVLKVHENAEKNTDPDLTDFLENELAEPIVSVIRELGVFVSNLSLADVGLGEYEFNKDLEKILGDIIGEVKSKYFRGEQFNLNL